jgi:cell division protein FtsB
MPKRRTIIISITAVVCCVIVYVCYSLIGEWHQRKIEAAKNQEQKVLQEQNETLKRKIANLEEKLNELKGQKGPSERLEEIFGKRSSLLSLEKSNLTFKEIEQLITAYFSYLDEMRYVEKNKLTGSAYDQYKILENDLSATLPLVSGEMQSLYNLFQNTTHFYRVLGKQRLSLVKDILMDESDIIEFSMKTFFIWYTYGDDNGKRMKSRPSLQVLYDYAGFFLNSLGGKSYLLRRDSKIRILTNFYSVLIIDIANDKNLNSNGIDIRPYIKTTFDDITDYTGLIDKSEYLAELEKLMVKYKMP